LRNDQLPPGRGNKREKKKKKGKTSPLSVFYFRKGAES